MVFRGIKSRVFLQFWILFFLSMSFIYVLVMFLFLERTTAHFTDQKRNTLTIACELIRQTGGTEEALSIIETISGFSPNDTIFFIQSNQPGISNSQSKPEYQQLYDAVGVTLRSGQPITQKVGKTFGLLFVRHAQVIVTRPIQKGGTTVAAGGLLSPLGGIYQDFRRVQKITFVFVVTTGLFFALIGNRQLSRVYFRPLQRLAKRAETYTDEDPLFFSVRKEDNEFSVLSGSLNKMLNRINKDKHVLRETIGSLQAANRELKQAQNDVIRAEKLATVGRLTSGIAHEIGNPIGIVLGYLDLMKQSDLTPEQHSDFIARSEKEITRINNIIRQLLDMSRTSADEPKPVAVHSLLEDLISVFAYQPSAGEIVFDSDFKAHQDLVLADPDRLRQVFLNILLNAVDAIAVQPPSQPKIGLITEDVAMETSQGNRGQPGIKIQIEDNGPGIRSADLPHLFDPFFTTKQPGKGTGMGLSVSFMIIEKLGGHLAVSNRAKNGAAFHVTLPLVEPEQSGSKEQAAG